VDAQARQSDHVRRATTQRRFDLHQFHVPCVSDAVRRISQAAPCMTKSLAVTPLRFRNTSRVSRRFEGNRSGHRQTQWWSNGERPHQCAGRCLRVYKTFKQVLPQQRQSFDVGVVSVVHRFDRVQQPEGIAPARPQAWTHPAQNAACRWERQAECDGRCGKQGFMFMKVIRKLPIGSIWYYFGVDIDPFSQTAAKPQDGKSYLNGISG